MGDDFASRTCFRKGEAKMITALESNRPVVEMAKVTKVYPPDVVALQNISFTVKKGETIFLTGMSGAGKTTLLKLICCIETPTKGLIEIAGKDLSKLPSPGIQRMRQKIGVAYQDFRLLPRRTVMQNISMPMEVAFKGPQEIRERVHELLGMLNMGDKWDKPAGKLSRGEQQRVALARAAANTPPLLLADEPTGNLDPAMTELVANLFNQLNNAGTTIIIATHDESLYRNTGHRVLYLEQGRLANQDMNVQTLRDTVPPAATASTTSAPF